MTVLKAASALLGFLLAMRSAHANDALLAVYWMLVFIYWVINYMEGIK